MENCKQNHKRDFAILLSILFHVLLFLFIFYKIKKQLDEEPELSKPNNPIFLSQDLASQVEQTLPENDEVEKPKEPAPEKIIEPLDLSTQLVNNENTEKLDNNKEIETQEMELEAQTQYKIEEASEIEQIELNELTEELKKFEEFKQAEKLLEKEKTERIKKTVNEKLLTKQIKKQRIRRSILPSNNDMPTIPNVIDYLNEELKTNLFKMDGNNAEVNIKFLSYQQQILNFFERAFSALYVGKTLGIPKYEFDQLSRGIVIEIIIDINSDGTVKWLHVKSTLSKFNECIEHALQYAAPYPNIPKNFNMEVFRLKTKFPMGLQRSGKGLMQVYPT